MCQVWPEMLYMLLLLLGEMCPLYEPQCLHCNCHAGHQLLLSSPSSESAILNYNLISPKIFSITKAYINVNISGIRSAG